MCEILNSNIIHLTAEEESVALMQQTWQSSIYDYERTKRVVSIQTILLICFITLYIVLYICNVLHKQLAPSKDEAIRYHQCWTISPLYYIIRCTAITCGNILHRSPILYIHFVSLAESCYVSFELFTQQHIHMICFSVSHGVYICMCHIFCVL